MKYAYYFFLLIFLLGCKKENTTPEESLLAGKVKSVRIYDTAFNTYDIKIEMLYDSSTLELSGTNHYITQIVEDSIYLQRQGNLRFTYAADTIYIRESGMLPDDNIYGTTNFLHIAVLDNKRISHITKYADGVEAAYYGCSMSGNIIEKIQEPYAVFYSNRVSDNYVFDGDNYTKFDFHHIFNQMMSPPQHVDDTAYITYTALSFDKHAPMQYLYSANTLSGIGFSYEAMRDVNYLLGMGDYFFYPPNRHLISSIRTAGKPADGVYFNYLFNTKNQLAKVLVNYPTASDAYFTYEIEYY